MGLKHMPIFEVSSCRPVLHVWVEMFISGRCHYLILKPLLASTDIKLILLCIPSIIPS